MTTNYDDVLDQLRAAGLLVERLEVGRIVRCRVEGDREKRGWYSLYELRLDSGDDVFVGSFGIWRGSENNAQKIQLKKTRLSDEQRQALKARLREDRRRAEIRRKAENNRAAKRASSVWAKALPTGSSEYLIRKGIGAHGVRYTETGSLVLPMMDTAGRVHGLQFILPRDHPRRKKTGRDKQFWPPGLAMKGHFFLIGGIPSELCLITEGYATAASLFEATGLPVAVAWSANNLTAVAQALRKRYKRTRLLICADDDYLTDGNPGVTLGNAAAVAVDGAWLAPAFSADRGGKTLTDFNDLHEIEGLHQVRLQLEAKLDALGWRGGASGSCKGEGGRGRDVRLKPIHTVDELLQRFSLVYGHKSTVFDHTEGMLLGLGDMREACSQREIHREWMESADRKLVRIKEVGFDPARQDPEITCNLFREWPTEPRSGSCEFLLDLLDHLCSGEENPRDVAEWILKWIAYPIQHPGAKMKTALVMHGPQGVGKNLFFEAVMAIYGEYGRIIDQAAVEDKFNDWASRKLFLIADEVVARVELFHTKNKLKGLITSDWIRINPKNVISYEERNHLNIVFLSNETQPLVLERDDRRYAVVWTPPQMPPQIYGMVKAEIDDGGAAALHDHLMHLDLADFHPWTQPPTTRSKDELIELSMDSTERFWRDWIGGDIGDIPLVPVRTEDLYTLYRAWSAKQGYPRYAPQTRLLAEISKRSETAKRRCRYMNGQGEKMGTFLFPPGAAEPRAGTLQSTWLAKCVEQFNWSVEGWRGVSSGSGSDSDGYV